MATEYQSYPKVTVEIDDTPITGGVLEVTIVGRDFAVLMTPSGPNYRGDFTIRGVDYGVTLRLKREDGAWVPEDPAYKFYSLTRRDNYENGSEAAHRKLFALAADAMAWVEQQYPDIFKRAHGITLSNDLHRAEKKLDEARAAFEQAEDEHKEARRNLARFQSDVRNAARGMS